MLIVILYIVLFIVYFNCPLPLRLLIRLINFLLPDPIPVLDEVIMVAGLIQKFITVGNIVENIIDFISEHKEVFLTILIAAIILIVKLVTRGVLNNT